MHFLKLISLRKHDIQKNSDGHMQQAEGRTFTESLSSHGILKTLIVDTDIFDIQSIFVLPQNHLIKV